MTLPNTHNVSGTIDCQGRDDLYEVLAELLGEQNTILLGHFDGSTSIMSKSDRVFFTSNGYELNNFHALVEGDLPQWLEFANDLEKALNSADLPYSLIVHEQIETRPFVL